MLQALITTIPKSGKPPDQVSNYRPISLLNCDIKFFSKLIAVRLSDILPSLVNPDQVGFIKNRQARDGFRRILDLIQIARSTPADSVLVSLDAEKAFDRVSWPYLQRVLSKFGFQGFIRQAISSLYTYPSAKVLPSGFVSSSFSITNGTRQGCPLSPQIFALCMEPLAQEVRDSTLVAGIKVGPYEHKIGLYADDILICRSPVSSIKALLDIINQFSQISYYKLNFSKTSIMPISSTPLRKTDFMQFGFQRAESSLPYLGIDLTLFPHKTIDVNVSKLISDLTCEIKHLDPFPLSWMARINLTKMLLLPRFLYLSRTMPYLIPITSITKLQNLFTQFIWNNKKQELIRNICFPPSSEAACQFLI